MRILICMLISAATFLLLSHGHSHTEGPQASVKHECLVCSHTGAMTADSVGEINLIFAPRTIYSIRLKNTDLVKETFFDPADPTRGPPQAAS